MSAWLWVLAVYFAVDLAALTYYRATRRVIRVTTGTLALAFITHVGFIVVAIVSAGAVPR
jgi:hypothetical protein